MALFLLSLLPISLFITVWIYFPKERETPRNFLHGLYGFLLAVPVLLIHTLVKKPLPAAFLFRDLFSNVLVYRSFQLFLAALFVYHLPFGFRPGRRDEKFSASIEWQSLFFFGAFYAAVSVVDAVIYFGDYHFTLLFYVPVSRLGIVFAATAALSFAESETGVRKAMLYAGTVVVPFLFSIGYPLMYLKMYGFGIPLTAVVFGGSFAAFHIWMEREYRPGVKPEKVPLRAR